MLNMLNSTPHSALSIQPEENVNIKWMQCFKIHSLLLSWISFRKMDNKINFCGGGGGGCCGLGGNDPLKFWSWSLMNKVAFLGPIMSRSKRFKSILMPDLDSTAKSNSRNNVLNIAGWFITKFCSSQSCLPCRDVHVSRRIFWCWNTLKLRSL